MKFISSWNCFFASKNFNHCLQTFGVIATASSASQAARPLLPARRGKHTHLHLRRNRGHQIGGAMRSKYSMEEHTHTHTYIYIYYITYIYISYNSIFPSCRVPRKKTVTSNFRRDWLNDLDFFGVQDPITGPKIARARLAKLEQNQVESGYDHYTNDGLNKGSN